VLAAIAEAFAGAGAGNVANVVGTNSLPFLQTGFDTGEGNATTHDHRKAQRNDLLHRFLLGNRFSSLPNSVCFKLDLKTTAVTAKSSSFSESILAGRPLTHTPGRRARGTTFSWLCVRLVAF